MEKITHWAVRKGFQPGIYLSREEAEAQVEGYSGALYQSFCSLAQAEAFMAGTIKATVRDIESPTLPTSHQRLFPQLDPLVQVHPWQQKPINDRYHPTHSDLVPLNKTC